MLTVAFVQIVYQGCFLLRGLHYAVSRLAIDDTYYYLQVAWNTSRLGFVTFDGLHRTNGLQFLWIWILAVLAAVLSSKQTLFEGCLILCLLLNALCYVPIHRLARSLERPLLGLILAFAWFNVNLTSVRWWLCGMENSVHSLVVWGLAASAVGIGRAGEARLRYWIGFSILLVLNVWCRVDAAILSLLLYGLVIGCVRASVGRRVLLTTTGIATAGAVVLFGGFYWMGRSWLPVSALIKTRGHAWTLETFPLLAARGFNVVTPVGFLVPSRLGENVQTIAVPGILGIATLAAAWLGVRAGRFRDNLLAPIWVSFGLAGLAQLLALGGMGLYGIYGIWYQSAYFVFCAFTVAMAVEEIVRLGKARGFLTGRILQRAAFVAIALYAGFAAIWFVRLARDDEFRESFFYKNYRVAQWIAENTRESDVFAAFNAGLLAYFSNRTVVNLDGLVNDYSYYREVIRGTKRLDVYLSENDVRYLVDYQIPRDFLARAPVVYSLEYDDRTVFRVVDFSRASP
jgi:hypothetical protein